MTKLTERTVVAVRDGVVLAELLDGDREVLEARNDRAFEADPDDRPALQQVESHVLAVLDAATGELLGNVSWHAEGYGPTANCAAWNIGIGLLPEARGRGVGTIAQRLLVEHLFATTEVDRIEASTEVANVAERKALTRAGFRAEGVIRGAAMRGGARRDYLAFGLLRSDLRPAHGERAIVAECDGVALAELFDGDRKLLTERGDGAFEADPDDRPMRSFALPHRLAVIDSATGALLGAVSWHAVSYGSTAACEAWNIGIGLLPEARGRGVGTIAQRLLVEHLFATTDVDRIEAGTEVENVAERKALTRAGFRAEGVLRGVSVRGGRRRDDVIYGLLRSDLRPEHGERAIVVQRDGVALAEPLRDDRERLWEAAASEFDLDPDERPRPFPPNPSSVLTIVDAATAEPIGMIGWHAVSYGGTLSAAAWNIGIGLVPEARGRGAGTTAQRLLAEHLFATTEVDRVEASTDVDNVAEQRALEKAGFRREGVLRGAQLRGGRRRDIVHYGLLRTDLS
ncbi:MAG TPA: GNAT family N-acetyltransferase [Actinophytocola sp.]|uniref:GNAT family N-acetyltransferase n=1 Tax=Actinophytocola sp. TaxID=1872138 RepID=UPI002DDD73EA|nr:GNAT family N-acetyltransferase [Actinophytocola sp.]HEV2781422.1 GNAT family N-acetyltransferase [Actinophytocola sp.]